MLVRLANIDEQQVACGKLVTECSGIDFQDPSARRAHQVHQGLCH